MKGMPFTTVAHAHCSTAKVLLVHFFYFVAAHYMAIGVIILKWLLRLVA